MENTKIEWCDHTFSPWIGCTKIPGLNGEPSACDFCYAAKDDKRHLHNPIVDGIRSKEEHWGKDAPRRIASEDYFKLPHKWNRQATRCNQVFCASNCDIMERLDPKHVSYAAVHHCRQRVFQIIEETPNLDWLLLTKRPNEFVHFLPKAWLKTPRPNVWLLTTVESSANLWRVDELMKVPAVVHGVSCEPLFDKLVLPDSFLQSSRAWVITGGETGSRKTVRPHDPDWFRSLRDQAVNAGAYFMFKQWGNLQSDLVYIGNKHFEGYNLLDGRKWNERPVFEGKKVIATPQEWDAYFLG